MLSNKVRTTTIPLAVSAALAVAALAPAVSQAAPKGGTGTWQNTCQNAQVSFENAKTAWEYSTSGVEAEKNYKLMSQIRDNAMVAGCSVN